MYIYIYTHTHVYTCIHYNVFDPVPQPVNSLFQQKGGLPMKIICNVIM